MSPRVKISASLRNAVWNCYLGNDKGTDLCLCCGYEQISRGTFECGHIISVKNGGSTDIMQLRPICGLCNKSIGAKNMIVFMLENKYSTDRIEKTLPRPIEFMDPIIVSGGGVNTSDTTSDATSDATSATGVSANTTTQLRAQKKQTQISELNEQIRDLKSEIKSLKTIKKVLSNDIKQLNKDKKNLLKQIESLETHDEALKEIAKEIHDSYL